MLKVNEIGEFNNETLKTVRYNQGTFSVKFFVNNEDYYLFIDIEYKTIENEEYSELVVSQIKFSNALDTFCDGSVSDSEMEELLMKQINIEFNNENYTEKMMLIDIIIENIKKFIKEKEDDCY